jgi:flagella basal body P-ring formation protein FlgA
LSDRVFGSLARRLLDERLTPSLSEPAMPLAILAAAALSFTDPAAIDVAVAQFAGTPAQPVDRRLRLRPCAAPLALSWRMPRRDAITVQCPDAGSWHLSVPLPPSASPATPSSLADTPAIIARGDAVTVLVAGDGFSVSRAGEAMEAGAPGAWIKVRVEAAAGTQAEPLRAQVVRPGLVTIPVP